MRISDWSSDVCSSDLIIAAVMVRRRDLADIFDGGRGAAAAQARTRDAAPGRAEAEFAQHRARGGVVGEMRRGQPRNAQHAGQVEHVASGLGRIAEPPKGPADPRSEERTGGKRGVSKCRCLLWAY